MFYVVIPTYQNYDILNRCLEHVDEAAEIYGKDVRIVLAENGFVFEVSKEKVHVPEHCELMKLGIDKNLYFANSVNLALEIILDFNEDKDFEGVVLLNDDAFVSRSFFSFMAQTNADYKGERLIGPVTNRCAGFQCMNESLTGPVSEHDEQDKYYFAIRQLMRTYKEDKRYREARWINGFCMFIPKKILCEFRQLDGVNFPLSGEEIDYCYRVLEATETKAIVDQWNFVYHIKGTTTAKMNKGEADKYWRDSADKLRAMYPYFPSQ